MIPINDEANCNEYHIANFDNMTNKSKSTKIKYIGETKLINKT